MVDAIIRVIDRLIQLVEIRKRFNRQMFEDHIDPIYKNLQIVIDDYREIILAIETKLNRGVKPQEVLEELITRRERYARVRDEVKKYAEALANAKAKLNEHVYEFARSSRDLFLFEPTMQLRASPIRSALSSLIDDLAYAIEHPDSCGPHVIGRVLIGRYKAGIAYHWDDISSKYFQLRAEYLK